MIDRKQEEKERENLCVERLASNWKKNGRSYGFFLDCVCMNEPRLSKSHKRKNCLIKRNVSFPPKHVTSVFQAFIRD